MKKVTQIILYIFVALFGLSFRTINSSVKGTYYNSHSETFWIYEFISDSTFIFKTKGHFGNSNTIGSYKILNDTIKFVVYPKLLQEDSTFYFNKIDPLIIVSDSCLFSVKENEQYCKLKDN